MELSNEQLWQAVLGELELSLSKASFTTWFKDSFISSADSGHIIIGVPNTFSQSWLKQKYHSQICQALQKNYQQNIKEVAYEILNIKEHKKKIAVIKKAKEEQESVSVQEENAGCYVVAPQPNKTDNLNPRYTFGNFVIGKGNELATAAAKAVSDRPGQSYNPLFIYGGVGLGKTHLMQAIGHEVRKKNNGNMKVLYVTCEQFTNDFISSIKSGRSKNFSDEYRSPDVLLIDDIQFLTGKEGTQEAFFHTFNELHNNNRQIVITSDRPPKAIATLEDRLLSRFEWGMIADVSHPDLETRIAILKTKIQEKQLELTEEIIQYIGSNIQNNVRELEGALNKIMAHCQMRNTEPSLDEVKGILFSLSTSAGQTGPLTEDKIIKIVTEYFGLSEEDILSKSREKRLAHPRQIIMYLLREEKKSSFPTIGQVLGGRDHTTAIHAHSKISKLLEIDEKLRQDINLLKQTIYA